MGLLSDPTLAPRNKFSRNLAKHSAKICTVFYLAGLAWFVCLAHPEFNHGTYLSENALSPGLVYPEMKQDSSQLVNTLVDELRREHAAHKTTTPHAWIAAKMRQIGLETHIHHFTLRFPFAGQGGSEGGVKEYRGKNVYGILRAPRIGSTEGVVFTAPYRPAASVHTDITASVPVLLAFADFARKKNYWAKDLVFLVTEQEQLGIQAWLEAYYEGGQRQQHNSSYRGPLESGNLPARAGALQAALNLEVQDLDIDYIDVKIEGLNGQLPNLDMFNLVQRITSREGLSSGYKQTPRKKRRTGTHTNIEENLRHMSEMLLAQATGVPSGNHGLFHRYRIESLTLEAVKRTTNTNTNNNNNGNRPLGTAALPLLKTIEGISRSLNNLLERFHQSYFFYLLVQNDRFVSIGDFMPCLVLLAGPMFIMAFLRWLTLTARPSESEQGVVVALEGPNKGAADHPLPFAAVLLYMGGVQALGVLCNVLPLNEQTRELMAQFGGVSSAICLLICVGLVAAVLPFLVRLPANGLALLQVGTLLFLGVALIVIGLLNFALGFLAAVFTVPLAILLPSAAGAEREEEAAGGGGGGRRRLSALRRSLAQFYAVLLHPLVALYLLILLQTFRQFPEASPKVLLVRAAGAAQSAISLTLMDCIIYGNWLYRAATAVFLPIWTLCWTLAVASPPRREAAKLKTN